MKKIIVSAAILFSLSGYSQSNKKVPTNEAPSHYCAQMKDGIIVVAKEGKVIMNDVILSNGAKITMDGTLIKTDGTNVKLHDGECVTLQGDFAGADPHSSPQPKKK